MTLCFKTGLANPSLPNERISSGEAEKLLDPLGGNCKLDHVFCLFINSYILLIENKQMMNSIMGLMQKFYRPQGKQFIYFFLVTSQKFYLIYRIQLRFLLYFITKISSSLLSFLLNLLENAKIIMYNTFKKICKF